MLYRFLFLVLLLIGCKQEEKLKTYITIVHTKELSQYGDRLQLATKTDTIRTTNDSLAYIDGAMYFLAHKRTYKGLADKGIKITDPQSFEVVDEYGLNVDVSEDFIRQVELYISSNGEQQTPLIDSLISLAIKIDK